MSIALEVWVKEIERTFSGMSGAMRMGKAFMRDPMRQTTIDPSRFFSPADGILVYQKTVTNDEDVVDIKGKPYRLADLLENKNFKLPCLVIGIFMTEYDVHVNRIPYSGLLRYESLTPISSNNIPMDFVEDDIVAKQIKKIIPDMSYVKMNARVVNEIYSPQLDYKYYVTQIADHEVNVISHFTMI